MWLEFSQSLTWFLRESVFTSCLVGVVLSRREACVPPVLVYILRSLSSPTNLTVTVPFSFSIFHTQTLLFSCQHLHRVSPLWLDSFLLYGHKAWRSLINVVEKGLDSDLYINVPITSPDFRIILLTVLILVSQPNSDTVKDRYTVICSLNWRDSKKN